MVRKNVVPEPSEYLRAGVMAALTISLAVTTTGCLYALAAGAGAGTAVVVSDDRKVGQQASDAGVTASVKTKLAADGQVSAMAINVDTYEGVVTLHGHVESQAQADRAVAIAGGTKGVERVESRLVVLPDASE